MYITQKYLILRRYFYRDTSGFNHNSVFITRFDTFLYRHFHTIQRFRVIYFGNFGRGSYRGLDFYTKVLY